MEHIKLTLIALTGFAFLTTGCSTAPEATATKSVDLTQSDTSYERGKYYLAKGYNGLALNHFKTALHNNPGDIPIMNAVAITYQRLDRPDMAMSIFEKALQFDSSSPQTLNNIGYFYLSSGQPSKAATFFKAIGNDSEYAQVAATNLQYAQQEIIQSDLKIQAALNVPAEDSLSIGILENVSLERISKTVYALNSKLNPTYQHAVYEMKLDPRLIVRSAYDE